MKVLCIKSLYKSTYKKNSFSKGKHYEIINADSEFIYIKNNEFESFSFSKEQSDHYYVFNEYFMEAK